MSDIRDFEFKDTEAVRMLIRKHNKVVLLLS